MDIDKLLITIQDKSSELVTEWGFKLLAAFAVFFIGKWVCRQLTNFLRRSLEHKSVDATLVGFLSNITYFLLLTMLAIAALGVLGINTGSFVAVVGALGLAIGFALQGTLSNFAAGVMVILFRPFSVGDVVEGGGAVGGVKEVGMFATTLNSPDGKRVIVPNAAMMGGNITNYTVEGKRRVDMTFGIDYGDDIKKAKEILEGIIKADARVLAEPALTIAVGELGDNSVNIVCRPWVVTADYWGVFFDTTEAVKYAFDEAGLSFPFPQQDVHMHQVA